MSFPSVINPSRRPGPSRNEKTYLTAMEYFLYPQPRPWGLLKRLAYDNGLTPQQLNAAYCRIKTRLKDGR